MHKCEIMNQWNDFVEACDLNLVMASENCALIFPLETKDSKQRLVKISFFYLYIFLFNNWCIWKLCHFWLISLNP